MSWQLQEAKQRFSELVRRAMDEGPQVVTRHGREVVVVVPTEEYERLTAGRGDSGEAIKEYLLSGPALPDLDIWRDRTPTRVVDLGDPESDGGEMP